MSSDSVSKFPRHLIRRAGSNGSISSSSAEDFMENLFDFQDKSEFLVLTNTDVRKKRKTKSSLRFKKPSKLNLRIRRKKKTVDFNFSQSLNQGWIELCNKKVGIDNASDFFNAKCSPYHPRRQGFKVANKEKDNFSHSTEDSASNEINIPRNNSWSSADHSILSPVSSTERKTTQMCSIKDVNYSPIVKNESNRKYPNDHFSSSDDDGYESVTSRSSQFSIEESNICLKNITVKPKSVFTFENVSDSDEGDTVNSNIDSRDGGDQLKGMDLISQDSENIFQLTDSRDELNNFEQISTERIVEVDSDDAFSRIHEKQEIDLLEKKCNEPIKSAQTCYYDEYDFCRNGKDYSKIITVHSDLSDHRVSDNEEDTFVKGNKPQNFVCQWSDVMSPMSTFSAKDANIPSNLQKDISDTEKPSGSETDMQSQIYHERTEPAPVSNAPRDYKSTHKECDSSPIEDNIPTTNHSAVFEEEDCCVLSPSVVEKKDDPNPIKTELLPKSSSNNNDEKNTGLHSLDDIKNVKAASWFVAIIQTKKSFSSIDKKSLSSSEKNEENSPRLVVSHTHSAASHDSKDELQPFISKANTTESFSSASKRIGITRLIQNQSYIEEQTSHGHHKVYGHNGCLTFLSSKKQKKKVPDVLDLEGCVRVSMSPKSCARENIGDIKDNISKISRKIDGESGISCSLKKIRKNDETNIADPREVHKTRNSPKSFAHEKFQRTRDLFQSRSTSLHGASTKILCNLNEQQFKSSDSLAKSETNEAERNQDRQLHSTQNQNSKDLARPQVSVDSSRPELQQRDVSRYGIILTPPISRNSSKSPRSRSTVLSSNISSDPIVNCDPKDAEVVKFNEDSSTSSITPLKLRADVLLIAKCEKDEFISEDGRDDNDCTESVLSWRKSKKEINKLPQVFTSKLTEPSESVIVMQTETGESRDVDGNIFVTSMKTFDENSTSSDGRDGNDCTESVLSWRKSKKEINKLPQVFTSKLTEPSELASCINNERNDHEDSRNGPEILLQTETGESRDDGGNISVTSMKTFDEYSLAFQKVTRRQCQSNPNNSRKAFFLLEKPRKTRLLLSSLRNKNVENLSHFDEIECSNGFKEQTTKLPEKHRDLRKLSFSSMNNANVNCHNKRISKSKVEKSKMTDDHENIVKPSSNFKTFLSHQFEMPKDVLGLSTCSSQTVSVHRQNDENLCHHTFEKDLLEPISSSDICASNKTEKVKFQYIKPDRRVSSISTANNIASIYGIVLRPVSNRSRE